MYKDINEISNELELSLHSVDAKTMIEKCPIPLTHEINPRDIIELNLSIKKDIRELNKSVEDSVDEVVRTARLCGGLVYGGSSVLEEIDGLAPRRFRTTSLSESCARGFMDITSQQIVLGISEESLGFELLDYFNRSNAMLLALSASSPLSRTNTGELKEEGFSRRPMQYARLCSRFPEDMWRRVPPLRGIREYFEKLQNISDQVNEKLKNGELDANWEELRKIRSNEEKAYSYIPFDRLEPHQIYWPIRVRPDHRNIEKGGKSKFSLELRVPDMPTTVKRMQMINKFVIGLAYCIADRGVEGVPKYFEGSFEEVEQTGKEGLNTRINGINMREAIQKSVDFAMKGLGGRGFSEEAYELKEMTNLVLCDGNDADIIKRRGFKEVDNLREYLVDRLRAGER